MQKKRKNIDLTPEAIRLLSYQAIEKGVTVKFLMEAHLEKMALTTKKKMTPTPDPLPTTR